MKRITIACILVVLSFSLAFADWVGDFNDMYAKDGIDKAVEKAMKQGGTPDLIVENGLKLKGLNPQNLVKALFCAGAKGVDIGAAATKYDISKDILEAGYKKSLAECNDVQPYTPIADDVAFSPPHPVPPTPVSPSRL